EQLVWIEELLTNFKFYIHDSVIFESSYDSFKTPLLALQTPVHINYTQTAFFTKIYALPKKCRNRSRSSDAWSTHPRATIQVTSTTLNSRINRAESTEFVVPIGKPFEFKDLTINIDTIETPPAPQMNSWFIKKENGVALWPENVYPNYRCGPKLQDCTLVEDCHCSPAEDRMMCTCRDQNLTEIFQRPDTHLPVQSGSTRIEVSGKAIKAKVRNSATSTITVKIKDNWKTSVYRTNEVCTSSTEEIRGCYACEEGVQVNITCTSTRMETMANLDCDSETFAIACSPKGAATTISFRSDYARFRRSCTLDCGGKEKTHLELAGNLKYTGSIWTSIYRIISGNTTVYDEINLPDGPHIWQGYMSYVKTLAAALIAVAIIYMITYAAINTTAAKILEVILAILFKIAKTLGKLAWWIITSPFQIYEMVRARRRLAHLHQLIILLLITMISPTHPLFHSQLIHSSHSFLPTPVHRFSSHTSSIRSQEHSSQIFVPFTPLPFNPLQINYTIDNNGTISDKMENCDINYLIALNKKVLKGQEDLQKQMDEIQLVQESLGRRITRIQQNLRNTLNRLEGQADPPGASPTETQTPTIRDEDEEQEDDFVIRIDGHQDDEQSSPRIEEDAEDEEELDEEEDEVEEEDVTVHVTSDPGKGEEDDEPMEETADPIKGKEEKRKLKVQRFVPREIRNLFPKGHPKMPKMKNIFCAICGEDHLTDVCLHIQSADTRKEWLQDNNKCTRCLEEFMEVEDERHDCPTPSCKYCGSGVHHSSVCARTVNVMRNPRPVRQLKKHPEVTSARCALCGAKHDPDQSTEVTQHRLEFLQNKDPKRCIKCLKVVDQGGPSTSEPRCNEKCETECGYCSSWEHNTALCPHPILSLEPSLERPKDEDLRPNQRPRELDRRSPGPEEHRRGVQSQHRRMDERERHHGRSPRAEGTPYGTPSRRRQRSGERHRGDINRRSPVGEEHRQSGPSRRRPDSRDGRGHQQ
ncbi:hypothetical protein CAEBREN_32292, partial [Caenorhabditis brenneri]